MNIIFLNNFNFRKSIITFLCYCTFLMPYEVKAQKDNQFENLGSNVNSEYSEISPLISPDGKTLYFIRSDSPENTFGITGSQDIWYSELQSDSTWGKAKRMDTPFNKEQYNGIVNITPDGNTLLIRGMYEKGVYKAPGYSFSQKIKNGWSLPEKVKIKKYKLMDLGAHNSAFLSNDGKTLILSFCKEENGEANDLYVSFFENNRSTWTKPKSLGKIINTKYNEIAPFLAADGVTLYYASDMEGGFGNLDIYMSKRQDDTWENWSDSKNLGNSINTESMEAYYSIDASGMHAYMVSDKNSEKLRDIVRIKLQEDIKPDPVVLIYGNIYNMKTKEPLEAAISYETLSDNGTLAGNAKSSPDNGEYKIVLPYGNHYGFSAVAKGFMSVSDNIDLRDIAEYKEIKRDLYLVPFEIGQTVRLQNIFFDYGKSDLRPESFPELDRVVKLLNENPNMKIEVGGHTDNQGNEVFNMNLSESRAQSVKNYFVSKNISEIRIIAKGYGKDKPVESNDTEDGRQLNRRVEFTILKK